MALFSGCCCAETDGNVEPKVDVLELSPYSNPDCIVEEAKSLKTVPAIPLPEETPEAEKETPQAEKEEAKPAETAPAGPGTTLVFDAGGTQISVLITSVPLGIVFKTEAPLMVKRVEPGSSAEKAGVKPDWIFKSIGGKSLDGLSYADAVELLKAELAPLPTVEREQTGQWSLEIEFLTGSGSKKIFFPYQPLGLTFERKVPIVVQTVAPGSLAETLGVQTGWTVKAIGGVQCDGEAYDVQLQRFKTGAKELPEYQPNK